MNAILRIKDVEMIEMTNEIHQLRMLKEGMRKEIVFRRQREEQLENNIRKLQQDLDKAQYEQDDVHRTLDSEMGEQMSLMEENKHLKMALDRLRAELRDNEEIYGATKHNMNQTQSQLADHESQLFSGKN